MPNAFVSSPESPNVRQSAHQMACGAKGADISQRVYRIDPLQDLRWAEFLERHPRSSVFHTPGWIDALRLTYGYEPVVYTTTQPGAALENGLLACRVRSRFTGRRLVSLPFSDHCDPLVDSPEDLASILYALQTIQKDEKLKSVEIRPRGNDFGEWGQFGEAESFCFHAIDLRPSLDELFRNLHKDSLQRKVRRAEREGVISKEGRSESLLGQFYQLMLVTRRRHELPPPSVAWFRNVAQCLGEKLKIRVASKDGTPIAAVFMVSYKTTAVYKYGCSDARFHNLGSMPFLFWKTIEDAKRNGFLELDLGRSDMSNAGLIQFKDRLGASRSTLCYRRYPVMCSKTAGRGWPMKLAKQIFPLVPDRLLVAAGKLLYPHIG